MMTRKTISITASVISSLAFCGVLVQGERGVGLTPDAEYAVLSESGVTPDSPAPGTAVAPVATAATSAPESTSAPLATGDTGTVETVTASPAPAFTNAPPADGATPAGGAVASAAASDSNAVVAADTGTDTLPVTPFTGKESKANLVSVALDDVPLQDVVRLFTKISGANIIASSTNLQGKVTVNLQDVEWKPALDSILDIYSMMVVEKVPGSGIYSVMPKAPGQAEPLIAQPIFLNHAQVSNVVTVVKSMVGPGGMVSPFPNANAIVVRASAADLSAIRKVIEEIDVPRQQVYIEAKFLELTDAAIKNLGINWQVLEGYSVGVGSIGQTLTDSRSKFNGARSAMGTVDSKLRDDAASGKSAAPETGSGSIDYRTSSDKITGKAGSTLADSTKDGVSASSESTVSRDTSDSIAKQANFEREAERIKGQHFTDVRTAILSADDFRLVLSALQEVNGISIVSNPKIIVANEETATIHIGENEPNIKGTVTAGQQGQANTTTYALDERKPYFEFGISLDVTPTINNQSNVTVRISPTLSRFVRDKVAPDNSTYPVEATKTIKTTFSLESGKTAAIGGLTETDERETVLKVPILGDIPLIGKYLFSHTYKKHSQTETIIFVTVGLANPRTVNREEGLPEETELAQVHLTKKAMDAKKYSKHRTALEKLR